jgi:hypothetical protein
MQCTDSEVDATFNCHTSAAKASAPIHCVFHDSYGSEPSWFGGGSTLAAGCVNVSAGSLIAKLGHLPQLNGGQYHFSGTVKACIPAADLKAKNDDLRKMLIGEFLKDLAAPASEGRVLDSVARKGNQTTDLNALSGAVTTGIFCIEQGADPDPEN